jgi:protein-L-isoaspartate(D-aspartate) O-methyltransferase
MHSEFARGQMITQQVRAWDVFDDRVLEAMRLVRRELFVPARYRELAFADAEIPLAHGQHMLPPKVIGRMLQALDVRSGARVLEVGTGSGYLSACLAQLGASVRSLEIHADLAANARASLERAQVRSVEVGAGDAFRETLGENYSHVVLTGSLPHYDTRFERALAAGGRLFVVVGEAPLMEARLVTRVSVTEWNAESLFETVIDPLQTPPRASTFTF